MKKKPTIELLHDNERTISRTSKKAGFRQGVAMKEDSWAALLFFFLSAVRLLYRHTSTMLRGSPAFHTTLQFVVTVDRARSGVWRSRALQWPSANLIRKKPVPAPAQTRETFVKSRKNEKKDGRMMPCVRGNCWIAAPVARAHSPSPYAFFLPAKIQRTKTNLSKRRNENAILRGQETLRDLGEDEIQKCDAGNTKTRRDFPSLGRASTFYLRFTFLFIALFLIARNSIPCADE